MILVLRFAGKADTDIAHRNISGIRRSCSQDLRKSVGVENSV
jgi:hypothetical protein